MIVRPYMSWFRLLFVWRGSVLPCILPRLVLVFAIAIVSEMARNWWLSLHADSALSIPTFTLLGVSLAIFLGFRNSVSYERFWEARKLWGLLLVTNRSLSRQAASLAPDSANTRLLQDGSCAFAYALKGQLRGDVSEEHLRRLLPAGVCERAMAARFAPAWILGWMGKVAADMLRAGEVSDLQWQALDRKLDTLSEVLGGCERIAATPLPFTYRVLLNRTVTIYSLLLPMGLVTSIGWLTPLIAVFIAYTYLALETIGEQLEEPFGREGNDLPLSTLCHTIEGAVRDMRGEEMPLPPPEAQGVYLH